MNKNQTISLLAQVKKQIDSQLTILSSLVDNYDQLNNHQQVKIQKSIQRISIFFSNEQENQIPFQSVQQQNNQLKMFEVLLVEKQEQFTDFDWQIIEEKILGINQNNKEILSLLQLYQLNENHFYSELQVDKKCNLQALNYYYYGYMNQRKINGRGVTIKNDNIIYGYFLDGILQVGISIVKKQQNILITLQDQDKIEKLQFMSTEKILKSINSKKQTLEQLSTKQLIEFQLLIFSDNTITQSEFSSCKIEKKRAYERQNYQFPTYLIVSDTYEGFGLISKTKGQFFIKHGIGQNIINNQISFYCDNEIIYDIDLPEDFLDIYDQ